MKDGKEETQSQLEMNLFVDQVKQGQNELSFFFGADFEDSDAREWRQENRVFLLQP